eukprot:TRINITY_DN18715_c0_g1_i1.p1 TRINITY_DN18715_c0_g1~~TRINITY_DN18715_c0_g1_i1.p1  ORF type:complete len:203 (-),score=63.18 TRINITY_DN18715_c0_g1_i1:299-907(-)
MSAMTAAAMNAASFAKLTAGHSSDGTDTQRGSRVVTVSTMDSMPAHTVDDLPHAYAGYTLNTLNTLCSLPAVDDFDTDSEFDDDFDDFGDVDAEGGKDEDEEEDDDEEAEAEEDLPPWRAAQQKSAAANDALQKPGRQTRVDCVPELKLYMSRAGLKGQLGHAAPKQQQQAITPGERVECLTNLSSYLIGADGDDSSDLDFD